LVTEMSHLGDIYIKGEWDVGHAEW